MPGHCRPFFIFNSSFFILHFFSLSISPLLPFSLSPNLPFFLLHSRKVVKPGTHGKLHTLEPLGFREKLLKMG